jgi:hypothetical protein
MKFLWRIKMAWLKATKMAGVGKGLGIVRKLWFGIFVAFISMILLNAIVIAIQEKDVGAGVEYLGNKFLYPTLTLGQESQSVIENGGIIFKQNSSAWDNLKVTVLTYSALFSSLFAIYVWFYILGWVVSHSMFSNTSNWAINHMLGLMFFFGTQMILLAMNGKSVSIPFLCFYDFLRAIPYLISPFSEVGEKFIDEAGESVKTVNYSI